MRILLTNDDGIAAPGLAVLESIARGLSDDIWIVAPAEENSGAGHALTLSRPLRLRQHAERRFAVAGTPTDAVTLALKHILPSPPDLILSGVNRGANLGDDITYSGTVAAAMEGALAGVRAVALSQVYGGTAPGDDVRFDAAREWGGKVLRPLLAMDFAPRTLINVNFPPLAAADVRGIRVMRQGFHDYARGQVTQATDPRGYPYFWFALEHIEHTASHATDLEAIAEGFIAVTPLQLDLTHAPSLAGLAEVYA